MAEPTLVQVFGNNATQDSNILTISKSDLAIVGLTANSENTAESLLAAVILKAGQYLTVANQETGNSDISITIEREQDTILTKDDAQYRQYQFTVDLERLEPESAIDPDFF